MFICSRPTTSTAAAKATIAIIPATDGETCTGHNTRLDLLGALVRLVVHVRGIDTVVDASVVLGVTTVEGWVVDVVVVVVIHGR
jgi:energy-converting hydrogenase Eha subunit F